MNIPTVGIIDATGPARNAPTLFFIGEQECIRTAAGDLYWVITEDDKCRLEPITAYHLAYAMVSILDKWFDQGLTLWDSSGRAIIDLEELLAAIQAGRWPVEGKSAVIGAGVSYAAAA